MRPILTSQWALWLILITLMTGWPVAGFALTLHEAKLQGFLGEKTNGYLGVIKPSAPVEAKALMREINRKRKAKYVGIAKRNNTALKAVETLAGRTAIKKTRPGYFIQLPSGQWSKK